MSEAPVPSPNPAKRPPKGRRVYLINPEFQIRFVGYTLGVAVATILIFYIANLFFFDRFISIGRDLALTQDHPFYRFLGEQRRVMNGVFFATSVLVMAFICVSGLLMSHRVAGPLYRFRNHLERLSDSGQLEKVSFRKGDFFPELAEAFNKFVLRLKK